MIKSAVESLTKTVRTKVTNAGIILVLAGTLTGATPILTQTAFAATNTVCTAGCSATDIQSAVTAANAGDTIDIQENQTVTTPIVINKQLTITSTTGATIQTSGSSDVLTINAAGAGTTITNLKFTKTDTVSQSQMISVIANNVTISNNTFTGQYNIGQSETERALTVSSVTGLTVSDNRFSHLRQPAYFNTATGTVSNNYTEVTRGFVVVSQSNLSFTGNTWGTAANINAVDIAIIKDSPAGPDNYLANLMAISGANNNAVIEDQTPVSPVMTDVFVDDSALAGGNGYPVGPYQTVTPALSRVIEGGRVHIANGNYSGGVNVVKAGTRLIGESRAGVVVTASSATPYGQGVSVVGLDGVSISNMTFNAPGGSPISYAFQAYKATNLTLTDLTFNGPGKSTTPRIGGVDFNSSQGITLTNVSASNYAKNGFSFTAQFTALDDYSRNITLNGITADNNNWAGIAFYTMNGSSTVGNDITGVTFNGTNTVSNNTKGIEIVGDSDANAAAHATPRWNITGSTGGQVNLGPTAFSGNTTDIINYQTNGLQALSATFGGLTGDQMSAAQRDSQDSKFTDKLDYSDLGLVKYWTTIVTVNNLSISDTTPALTGTVNDKNATVTVTINGHTYTANVSPTANGSGTYDWNVGVADALPVGTYDVAVTATDGGGNVAHDGTTNELVITAPPAGGGPSGGSGSGNSSGSTDNQGGNGGNGGTMNTVTGGGRGAGFLGFNGFGADIGEVLGTAIDNPAKDSDKKGQVKSTTDDKTDDSGKSTNAFLGLGWWWLPIVVALAALLYFLYRRFRPGEEV